ncbi:hypothetical protein CNE_1c13690 [Cupriavidus necator N-1]|uniref:Uncharacterized protein n=1 Tax=Cupriavidus necator (strain ATCC 43291 / DSM 13513 / CCUG 52238 / LMG 8453 / N-1) TaxID=1042878 RepID=G0ESS1_CUPNN|nr:hypothetical protein [Cupriavidus necator]AEI76718.1 hypothetical protein CNE_1c13690 [Cupriavidus necator N-1]MDX6014710.1 hypothetical protein [Cupriavidus necator]
MATHTTIFLEAHYFGEDSEELRLPCDAVAALASGLVVSGIEVRHLRALKWRPDHLSYWDEGQLLRLAVGPWIALDAHTVRFTLR